MRHRPPGHNHPLPVLYGATRSQKWITLHFLSFKAPVRRHERSDIRQHLIQGSAGRWHPAGESHYSFWPIWWKAAGKRRCGGKPFVAGINSSPVNHHPLWLCRSIILWLVSSLRRSLPAGRPWPLHYFTQSVCVCVCVSKYIQYFSFQMKLQSAALTYNLYVSYMLRYFMGLPPKVKLVKSIFQSCKQGNGPYNCHRNTLECKKIPVPFKWYKIWLSEFNLYKHGLFAPLHHCNDQ